jgi:hypothetical protein
MCTHLSFTCRSSLPCTPLYLQSPSAALYLAELMFAGAFDFHWAFYYEQARPLAWGGSPRKEQSWPYRTSPAIFR